MDILFFSLMKSILLWEQCFIGATNGAMDAGNLLKLMIGCGELRCIGATTLDEYRKYIEKDPALERQFQQVYVDQPTVEDIVSILRGLCERYELHHGVRISDSALVEAAILSDYSISGDDDNTNDRSPERQLNYGEEWAYSLELSDEYAFDDEVGKRSNQMASVPHVPRVNGEILSVDEATLDHQRLLDRLQLYQLVESKVRGDRNWQVYRTTEHHKFVSQQIVNQLKLHAEIYEGYVPMVYADYLENMAKVGEWGDHVTLQAAADLLQMCLQLR